MSTRLNFVYIIFFCFLNAVQTGSLYMDRWMWAKYLQFALCFVMRFFVILNVLQTVVFVWSPSFGFSFYGVRRFHWVKFRLGHSRKYSEVVKIYSFIGCVCALWTKNERMVKDIRHSHFSLIYPQFIVDTRLFISVDSKSMYQYLK